MLWEIREEKMARIACRWIWLIMVAGLVLGTQGCREDERDRVLMYEPGVYKGQPDQSLEQAQVDELRHRARQQKF